ncbi:MAG: SpoIIE family protein phosphatase, partial [Oscillospiraceae bacterium]|nr:SpoIIE family protein phosphatase [Oscillospiraceae bacterium]
GLFSLGHICACIIILLSAYTGGIGAGAAVGAVLGFSVSLAESSADFCMVYSLLGICSAAFCGKNKYLACLLSASFSFFAAVCLNPSMLISAAAELALSCPVFIATQNLFARYSRRFFTRPASRRDIHIRAYASERLRLAAESFRNLSRLLTDTRPRTPATSQDEKTIFEKTSHEICKKCTLAKICWERDFEATRDALNNATRAIRENGALSANDFPIHFSSRCIHIENFVNTVNRELFSLRYKNRFEGRLHESQALLTKQYSDASHVFSSLSSDISDNARFDEEAELALHDLFASYGILCDTAVYRDSRNHINIHLCGKDLSRIANEFDRFSDVINKICGAEISAPQYTRGDARDDIIMREKPNFRGAFGAAVKRKNGTDVSGDSGSLFRPSNSHLALLLSDGMGSGRLAAHESAGSVKLLEGLLKSGISPQDALSTLQAALTLKAEYTGTFATLDLMYADMFSGNCEFYKYGGAPTYIKRGRQIRRITASSLPAGITLGNDSSPDRTSVTLCEGDFVVMMSDGISDGCDDGKLLDFLSKSDETSPKAFADAILAYSFAVYEKNDDMTVAVVKIEREE